MRYAGNYSPRIACITCIFLADVFISRGFRGFLRGHSLCPCCHSGQCRVCLALKTQGGNFFEELRPERPKAHSPGQGEQREPTPWVCSTPTIWRPEGAKTLNHKIV